MCGAFRKSGALCVVLGMGYSCVFISVAVSVLTGRQRNQLRTKCTALSWINVHKCFDDSRRQRHVRARADFGRKKINEAGNTAIAEHVAV